MIRRPKWQMIVREMNEPPLESGNGSSGTQEQEAVEEPDRRT